ncbi:hypothetical protein AVEN_82168-1 [Araneus ventricosus]|uniref:Uncharacterized protein n=1 Tax=Araneus ventricosus TaxID=182803 RepID=A0A4Y2IXG3_ARAVE|nr:hypothetical protein AVEN_82168-1 [Araneus ventricosus]
MTRVAPELATPSSSFRATPTGGRLATTYDLACGGPHARRIFCGIGSLEFEPATLRSRGRGLTSRPPQPYHCKEYPVKRGGLKRFLSSSVCRRSPNCPQDRIFNAKCELQSILHMVEVQGQSGNPIRRNSKNCENLKVSGYF